MNDEKVVGKNPEVEVSCPTCLAKSYWACTTKHGIVAVFSHAPRKQKYKCLRDKASKIVTQTEIPQAYENDLKKR